MLCIVYSTPYTAHFSVQGSLKNLGMLDVHTHIAMHWDIHTYSEEQTYIGIHKMFVLKHASVCQLAVIVQSGPN